jgi:DNA repair protein RadC
MRVAMTSEDRPRERLRAEGPDRMSDAELIAIVLGTGTRGRPVHDLARDAVDALGGLVPLSRASPQELSGAVGLGAASAARLAAAFHLGRRAVERVRQRTQVLLHAEDVYRRLQPRLAGLVQEVFVVVAMNARGMVMQEVEIARGTVCRVDVHPREVFRPLISMAASSAIVVHNHPSGDVEPSVEDISLTERLRAVGEVVGIPVVDHIVIADGAYRSIAEHMGAAFFFPPPGPD